MRIEQAPQTDLETGESQVTVSQEQVLQHMPAPAITPERTRIADRFNSGGQKIAGPVAREAMEAASAYPDVVAAGRGEVAVGANVIVMPQFGGEAAAEAGRETAVA
jgi:hypothetical protein